MTRVKGPGDGVSGKISKLKRKRPFSFRDWKSRKKGGTGGSSKVEPEVENSIIVLKTPVSGTGVVDGGAVGRPATRTPSRSASPARLPTPELPPAYMKGKVVLEKDQVDQSFPPVPWYKGGYPKRRDDGEDKASIASDDSRTSNHVKGKKGSKGKEGKKGKDAGKGKQVGKKGKSKGKDKTKGKWKSKKGWDRSDGATSE